MGSFSIVTDYYLEFTSKAFNHFQFIGVELIVAMQNANFNDNLYDVLHQSFGIFFVPRLKTKQTHEMKNTIQQR